LAVVYPVILSLYASSVFMNVGIALGVVGMGLVEGRGRAEE
jgi:hypothetical protein